MKELEKEKQEAERKNERKTKKKDGGEVHWLALRLADLKPTYLSIQTVTRSLILQQTVDKKETVLVRLTKISRDWICWQKKGFCIPLNYYNQHCPNN